ncbi:MAG: DUF2723 domain-containing protein [Deltaproteobacteria bacterium]|nr:DUF2723 domain-containing protein [Deltaproteobacteria bacterium]
MGKRKRGRARSAAPTSPAPLPQGQAAPTVQGRWLAPLVAFAGLFALYVVTLAPSVVGGDCGELTAASLTGGVPHPPGYPLFAMLARGFAWLPLGHSPAWRVNLLSAFATAGAAAVLCATVQLWTREAAAGLVAAALFGTNELVWRHATAAEVFGLNALFVALAFFLWLSVERPIEAATARRRVFALFLVCGLAMCNHHTFVFVGAPLALRSLWVCRRSLGARGFALALAVGLAGLSPYAYLWVASHSQAAVSWGAPMTFDGWLAHILRRNYGTFSLGRATKGGAFVRGGTFVPTLWLMLGHAFPRFFWIGPPLSVLGFFAAIKARHERKLACVLLAVLGGYVLVFCALSNLSLDKGLYITVLSRFCIQSDLVLAMAAGVGFARLARILRTRWPAIGRRARFAPGCGLVVLAIGILAHGRECNQRGNHVFADFVTTAFASLPENAIVITMGDHLTGSVFYFREVEKLRPDIIHLDRELLGFPWYGERKRRLHPDFYLPEGRYGRNGWHVKKLLDGNPRRPLAVIDRLETWDESWKDGYKLATFGLVHRLLPASQYPSYEEWLSRDRAARKDYDVGPALAARVGSWETMVGELVLTAQAGRAHVALLYSKDNGYKPGPARTAIDLLEDIIAKAGGDEDLGIRPVPGLRPFMVSANIWKDLGISYEVLSRSEPSFLPRVAIAYEKFVERAPPDDKDVPTAREYVKAHRPARSGRP